jgi:hypothetical protein
MLVPLGEDRDLKESPVIIFTRKFVDGLMEALLTTIQPGK